MHQSRPFRLVAGLAGALAGASPVVAQTVKEAVRQHVKDQLDKPAAPAPAPAKAKPRPVPAASPAAAAPPPGEGVGFTFSTDEGVTTTETKPAAPAGPELPLRVFGSNLQVDLKADGGYRGWVPQQYTAVDVEVAGYYTWSAEVKARLFRFLNLHKGYYESNALSAPRTSEAAVASEVGTHIPKAAWLMAMVGFPVLKVWEPIVRYEARAFNTTAKPQMPVCLVPRDSSGELADCPRTMDSLRIISSYETLVLGVQYHASKDPSAVLRGASASKKPPVYLGVGLMSYTKPYQVNVDGATLNEYLFDGRFRGAGLAAGTSFDGGLRSIFGSVNAQVGLGRVELTRGLTLNELAPEDWLIGYLHGELTLGYRFVLVQGPPTILFTPVLTGGGASFHFFKTKAEMTAAGSRAADAPNVNWDFLWSARAALVVAL